MKIHNINGASDIKCSCRSWIAHWAKFSGQTVPTFCPACGCMNQNLIGAHVQKEGGKADKKYYIYPLCEYHKEHKGELEVSSSYRLVPADKKQTCEKIETENIYP